MANAIVVKGLKNLETQRPLGALVLAITAVHCISLSSLCLFWGFAFRLSEHFRSGTAVTSKTGANSVRRTNSLFQNSTLAPGVRRPRPGLHQSPLWIRNRGTTSLKLHRIIWSPPLIGQCPPKKPLRVLTSRLCSLHVQGASRIWGLRLTGMLVSLPATYWRTLTNCTDLPFDCDYSLLRTLSPINFAKHIHIPTWHISHATAPRHFHSEPPALGNITYCMCIEHLTIVHCRATGPDPGRSTRPCATCTPVRTPIPCRSSHATTSTGGWSQVVHG